LGDIPRQAAELWETDGLRLLESRCSTEMAQMTFSAKPEVAPVLATSRVKGRLQHAQGGPASDVGIPDYNFTTATGSAAVRDGSTTGSGTAGLTTSAGIRAATAAR
jgi:hypothetical protein